METTTMFSFNNTLAGDPEVDETIALAREIEQSEGCTLGEAFKLATLQLAELTGYARRWDATVGHAEAALLDYAAGWDAMASAARA
jgi:hypothetical protein